jgi:hypothetical protein
MDSRVPGHAKVFWWLLHLNRLNTRDNLHHKLILDTPYCPRCPNAIEDREHLLLSCPSAKLVWQRAKLTPQLTQFSDINSTLPHSV